MNQIEATLTLPGQGRDYDVDAPWHMPGDEVDEVDAPYFPSVRECYGCGRESLVVSIGGGDWCYACERAEAAMHALPGDLR